MGDYTTAICIVDDGGETILETSTATTAEAISSALKPYRRRLKNVGQESGANAVWLHRELTKLKYPMRSMDAFHAHSLLRSRLNKTDRNDAQGLALLLAKGLYRPSHIKSERSVQLTILLTMREAALRKVKDLDLSLRAAAKRLGPSAAVTESNGNPDGGEMRRLMEAGRQEIADACEDMRARFRRIDTLVNEMAANDPVCRRLMTVPGVGPITALTFIAIIDNPERFSSSRNVAAYLGLTPRVFQSGVSSRSGGISHRGNASLRKALFMAARSLVSISRSQCALRKWGVGIASAKGNKTAYIACARKMAVLLHHLWITGQEFDPDK